MYKEHCFHNQLDGNDGQVTEGRRSDGAKLYMSHAAAWRNAREADDQKSVAYLDATDVLATAQWYAACTSARHEKRIAERFERDNLEFFLPLYDTVHQWRNGRKKLRLPLLPGYIFVRIPLRERLRVLQVPGVAYLVGYGTCPTPIPDGEMQVLRTAVTSERCMEPHPFLRVGEKVRVVAGPLTGAEGILLRKKENFRVVLSVELVVRSVIVDVDGSEVAPVSSRMPAPSYFSARDN